jgi:ketosteroid isomerase-like protein
MSTDKVATVRGLYRAFEQGAVETVLGALTDDVEWYEAENSPYGDRSPYRSPAAVGEGVFARLDAEWAEFEVQADRFLDAGDTVVVLGRYRGIHRTSGRTLDAQFAHVFDLRGDTVTGFRQYTDTKQFFEVAGG